MKVSTYAVAFTASAISWASRANAGNCTQTPVPQSMSGEGWLFSASTLDACQRVCRERNCNGFTWQAQSSSCIVFNMISMSFDSTDAVPSWRCGAQIPASYGQIPGLDLAQLPTATAADCSYKCEATAGCYAYSWSSGGSCALKSEKPSTFIAPFDGSVVSGEPYKCGQQYVNIAIDGADLATAPAAVWTDCCAICRRTIRCDGFSWTNGVCRLKTNAWNAALVNSPGTFTAFTLRTDTISGPLPCTETDKGLVFGGRSKSYYAVSTANCYELCLMTNCAAFTFNNFNCVVSDWFGLTFDVPGHRAWRCHGQLTQEKANYNGLTIASTASVDAIRCSYVCDATPGCWAYSWTKDNGGTCTLKSDKPAAVSAPFDGSVVSGEAYKCTTPQFDVDVIGDDLASVQRPAWSDCCGVCRRTQGCEAFSWSNFNTGTCWLKTRVTRGNIKIVPGVVSGYIFTSVASSTVCTSVSKSFYGVWSSDEPLKTRAECQQLCLFMNCAGYEWTANPSKCRIYDWITSVADPASGREYWRCRAQLPQENGDYAGSDLGNVPAASPTLCSYKCEETAGCFSYTWSNFNGGVCYMKTNKPIAATGVQDGSLVSGEALKCYSVADFEDIVGADLASVARSSWTECCGVCRRTAECKAFSWTTYNGGTCWLKTNANVTKMSVGVITGRV